MRKYIFSSDFLSTLLVLTALIGSILTACITLDYYRLGIDFRALFIAILFGLNISAAFYILLAKFFIKSHKEQVILLCKMREANLQKTLLLKMADWEKGKC